MDFCFLDDDPVFVELARNLCLTNQEISFLSGTVEPLEGYYDCVVHSDGYHFYMEPGNADTKMSARQVADLIREDPEWDGFSPIRLLACNAGAYEYGAAHDLSMELGVEIYAATGYVLVSNIGIFVLYDDELEDIADDTFLKLYKEHDPRLFEKQDGRWESFDCY